MTRQMRIKLYSEVYIKEELEDNSKPAKIYKVVEESVVTNLYSCDGESNYEYYLKEIDNDEAKIVGPYYPESLVDAEEAQHPGSEFPSFKSYGLTKEQVLEVVMLFMTQMADLHRGLAEEAMADGNYQWAIDYFKECQVFLNVKILEDKLYHRFVAE